MGGISGLRSLIERVKQTARLGRRVVELERVAEAQRHETSMLKRLIADEMRLHRDETRLLREHLERLLESVSAMNAKLVALENPEE